MTAIVRVWGVGSVGPWGRARGRFIDVHDGHQTHQLWTFDDYRGQLLASLCQAAKEAGRPIQVTWSESKYGAQLRQVDAVAEQVHA